MSIKIRMSGSSWVDAQGVMHVSAQNPTRGGAVSFILAQGDPLQGKFQQSPFALDVTFDAASAEREATESKLDAALDQADAAIAQADKALLDAGQAQKVLADRLSIAEGARQSMQVRVVVGAPAPAEQDASGHQGDIPGVETVATMSATRNQKGGIDYEILVDPIATGVRASQVA